MIHLVTAVSRPENIPRIHRSIELSLVRSNLQVKWIVVVDTPETLSPKIEKQLESSTFEIQKLIHSGGRCLYGIAQKNLGMESVKEGFFHCLDDDNLVHPLFFFALERAMKTNPSKRAFVVSQQRWDSLKLLTADPDRMGYGQIDNTMFTVHSSLIGRNRYDLKQSGKEDFLFFSNLWNLHREEFVFIPEVLSYYNYIRYFPAESPQEPIRQPVQETPQTRRSTFVNPIPPLKVAAVPKPKGVMKIGLYSSKRDQCGISTYTSHLEATFIALGHDVRYFGSQPPYEKTFDEIRSWKPDIFHFQHETSIMPPEDGMKKYADLLRAGGSKVLITLHTENPETIRVGRKVVMRDRDVILHRPSPEIKDATVIPMPCTTWNVRPDRTALRKKFGIPEDAFVLSTVGFLIPWKDHPKIVEAMIPWISRRPELYIQIIASDHFSPDLKTYADVCRKQLLMIAKGFSGERICHVGNYPSDLELVERLAASDLGYVWCPFDTGSSSAAAAQFTTARCPLVATDSTHYAFLGTGIVRCQKDLKAFVETIEKTAEDAELLGQLKANQWDMYRTRNYIETARKHLALYEQVNA